jgi:hypothetical protein
MRSNQQELFLNYDFHYNDLLLNYGRRKINYKKIQAFCIRKTA